MKNKFRQNIVIGVIAIVGTMGYNLSINQENENVRLITGNIEALAEEEGGAAGVSAMTGTVTRESTIMTAISIARNFFMRESPSKEL